MNPNNHPRIVSSAIWDKHMADAFSLTEPMQDANQFDLLHSKLNPESVLPNFPADGYSNFSAGAIASCNLKYPPPRVSKKRKEQYQNCLAAEQKRIDDKKASGGGGGVLGIGSGKRKACKEAGLTGAEKRACAKELKARGWKKGQPMPPDMAGISSADVEVVEAAPTTSAEITPAENIPAAEVASVEKGATTPENPAMKFLSGLSTTEKIMLGGGVVIGIGLLIYGISGAGKKPSLNN
jgi:hypothetical protein